MNVPVLWISLRPEILARGYADQGFLEAVLDRSVWRPPTPIEFEHHELHGEFHDAPGAVVIFNARTHTAPEHVAWINEQLTRLTWAVVLICGDEEWIFPWEEIQHPHVRLWAMQPRPEHANLGLIPGGWYPHTHEHLAAARTEATERPLDWFFAGQVNHARRRDCVAALDGLPNGKLATTKGYLQEAIPRAEYFRTMASAKVIPAPSGPYSVDCARAFEALEAGCVPVCDVQPALAPGFDYWTLLFGADHRIPTISDWSTFPAILEEVLARWPALANQVYSRYQQWKRRFAHQLDADIHRMAGTHPEPSVPDDLVTVIVTTSPVPRHPDTDHIEETIGSVRGQLPDAEIIVVADGVRPEQEHRRGAYDEYLRRLLWLTNFEWSNVVPLVLDRWAHQAHAVSAALELVTTPLMLFVEHDTPIIGDIPWSALCEIVQRGEANTIRFHEDVTVHPDHERVMLDPAPVEVATAGGSVPLRRTVAWWQRPHLASTRFYRERIMATFGPRARTMIEDRVYGDIETACLRDGGAGWWDWRIWIYQPEGNMRRSGHLDSRGEDPKYPMRFR